MRKWMPLVAVCLGTFMLLVDVTIVTVALPDMAVDLKTSFSSLQWVVDIYTLILAALLLAMGSVADLYGRRRLYLGGLVVFALASLASGLARNTALLIAARGVQGIGGAAMYATTIALLSSSYHGRDRGIAFGVWGAVSGAAAAAGPILGGLLTQSLSWRWIFFVNLPVSVVALVASRRSLAADRPAGGTRPDVPGLVTFTLGAAATTYGLIRAAAHGWGSAATLGLLGLGLAAFAAFILIERTRQRRGAGVLLDLALFRRPAFCGVMIAALLLNAAAFAYLPYTSLWLQTVLRLTPVKAGLLGSAPLSLAAFVISALIGRFLHSRSPRWIIGGGLALVGAGALLQATLSGQSGDLALLPGLIVAGVGVGLATPPLVSSAMAAVPARSAGMAAGAVNTARQLGFTFGVAVLGGVFSARVARVLDAAGPESTGGRGGIGAVAPAVSGGQAQAVLAHVPSAQRGLLDHLVHAATASGLNQALLVAGLLGLAAALVTIVTVRRPVSPQAPDQHTPAGREPGAQATARPAPADA
jgi:EmrB/QacA subfamily drug resistance transporter